MRTYKTTSRRLERFFYAHYIRFIDQYRNSDGDVVWVYEDTRQLRDILWEYHMILKQQGIIDDRSSA